MVNVPFKFVGPARMDPREKKAGKSKEAYGPLTRTANHIFLSENIEFFNSDLLFIYLFFMLKYFVQVFYKCINERCRKLNVFFSIIKIIIV